MPRRSDLRRILLLGSGPIVIGQACEFDYSGTQACKALRAEGYEVILINSNPASIMTDPEMADRTYIEPLTPDVVTRVIEQERPDALLPTMGGQTALNLAVTLAENGTLERCGVELIGADLKAIQKAEDRLLFKQAMERIGVKVCPSGIASTQEEAEAVGAAILAIGKPVALLAKADDRLTLGFISITTTSPLSGLIANWMLLPPVATPISRMMAIDWSRNRWYSRSVRVWAGATVIESPVCTPMGSRFSMLQTITTLSARSRITSSSNSFQPRSDCSIRI